MDGNDGTIFDAIENILSTIWEETKQVAKKIWDAIVNWILKTCKVIRDFVIDTFELGEKAVCAVGTYVKNVGNGTIEILHRVYYKKDGRWYGIDQIKPQRVNEESVPAWAKQGLKAGQEKDITEGLLELELSQK